jgi:hypothetical protein
VPHAATEITAPDSDNLPAYWQFHEAVARAQLAAWLPPGRRVLVDISGPRAPSAELAAKAGHSVLRCLAPGRVAPGRGGLGGTVSPQNRGPRGGRGGLEGTVSPQERGPPGGRGGLGGTVSPQERGVPGGRPPGLAQPALLIADLCRLPFLADSCADGVIADDRALSMQLAAETMIAEIARVLRPGGRVLACVDSLVLGMAVLADQHHWAHLVDLPHAEVVLVPWPDGSITRCYGPDQARELFNGAGLEVHWIRPRTAFSESTVTHLLQRAPNSLPKLVRAELAARSDSSLGAQLVISASKPLARNG